jgi:hypothetical protein
MWTCTDPDDVSEKISRCKDVEQVVPRKVVPAQRFCAKDLQLTLKTKGGDAATFRSILPWSR